MRPESDLFAAEGEKNIAGCDLRAMLVLLRGKERAHLVCFFR
jgi:hypothetical protein